MTTNYYDDYGTSVGRKVENTRGKTVTTSYYDANGDQVPSNNANFAFGKAQ